MLVATGCSAPKSRVHGTVLYQGKPVAGGSIVLICPDNSTSPARIAEDGSYVIAAASRGHILVAIQAGRPRPSPRAQPNAKAAALKDRNSSAKGAAKTEDEAKMAALGTPRSTDTNPTGVPARYGDPNQSGLSFELVDSDQEYNVDLK
jgi:hypothetical protein